jgi:preprotein translocase subunit SecE
LAEIVVVLAPREFKVAKSKSRSSASTIERKSTNALVQYFYAVRSELRKVTWPTRDEARALTTAVTIGTVVIAIFLFMVDLLFDGIIGGIVRMNVAWIVAGVIIIALLGVAFYANGREE